MSEHECEAEICEGNDTSTSVEKPLSDNDWRLKYDDEDRDFLERIGADESSDPRAEEFNRRLLHIGKTSTRSWQFDLWHEYLCEDYWLTPKLESVFVEPFRTGSELRLPKACPKFPDWIKRYPQWTWLFLSVFGVDETNYSGATRFNRTIILAARAANFWESFSPGFELLLKHYWEEYKPKELGSDETVEMKTTATNANQS